jgi:hypothetical protein
LRSRFAVMWTIAAMNDAAAPLTMPAIPPSRISVA